MSNGNRRERTGSGFRRAAMFLLGMTLFLFGTVSGAEPAARKTVRVPALATGKLMVLDEDNVPVSGYAYDYIQMIGTYAGWDIEFIPCDNFSDAMKLLLTGGVDLFYDVSRTPERERKLLFPEEPMGNEYYYLYTLSSDGSVIPGDYASMQGKRVGVTSGTTTCDLLKQWCKKRM